MAVDIHYVNTMLVKINNTTGAIIGSAGSVSDPSVSFKDVLNFSVQNRVMPDNSIPNSTNYPTVKDYLVLEASDGYQFAHLDQYTIVTQKLT